MGLESTYHNLSKDFWSIQEMYTNHENDCGFGHLVVRF